MSMALATARRDEPARRDERSARRPAHDAARARGTGIALSAIAWQPQGNLDFAQWIEHGRRLGVAGRGAGWWIGDWVRYGAVRYGGRYARAARVTGYDQKTLTNMVYVASRFEISRRRENLSWSHHAEVAPLPEDERERWLDRAEAERLSVRQLRQELARHRRALDEAASEAQPDERPSEAAEGDRNVCPRCGFQIEHE